MALSDRSIDPRLLASAKKHFLKYGFRNAFLTDICKDADITTGAVYTRYKGKEELFHACVRDILEFFDERLDYFGKIDLSDWSDHRLLSLWCDTEKNYLKFMNYINNYRDSFEMLLNCAAGTRYENFRRDFCAKVCAIDYRYLAELQKRGLARMDITREDLYILLKGSWELLFEPIVHDLEGERLEKYIKISSKLVDWKSALGLKV